ncbi:hypothetical protein [Rheinheimera maricola]|uniref:Uncharacterized protein n=1 Tax=Rheinheimera maricola TaxID=2793282 RepID=A0ABS7XCZ3_9GAMM|nr:hypothetical protein [Rheinheimera maricola]MBZ9613429.1 hypothetical protein [Rheinheimera maricola]
MNELKVIVLSIHCNLASINIVVNDIPIYQSSLLEHKLYEYFVLTPHLKKNRNSVSLTVKNDWSKPERLNAFCDIKVIEKNNHASKTIEAWRWDERTTPIYFKPYTKHFTFSSDAEINFVQLESTPSTSINALLANLVSAIQSRDIDLLLNGYLITGLHKKYLHSGLPPSEWMAVEAALWQRWLSEPFGLVQTRDTRLEFSHGHYTWVSGKQGQAPIAIEFDWGQVELGFIVTIQDNGYHIIHVDYAVTEAWHK